MHRLIAAAAAVLLSGVIGALSISGTEAQERGQWPEPVPAPHPGFIPPVQPPSPARLGHAPDFAELVPGQVQMLRVQPEAGTWQIVAAKDATLLLNTATGETFRLAEKDGNFAWKPIERPMPRADAPPMPRLREMPRTPDRPAQPDRPNPDRPNAERLRKALEDARKRLKEAEGDEREALKRKIEEVEKTLREVEKNEGRDQPKGEVEDLESLLARLGDKIAMLEKKIKETDSKREAAELEAMANELRGEVKRVKQELEAARKERKERD